MQQNDLSVESRLKLMNVVNENLLDPVGISCNLFTISYQFLGSVIKIFKLFKCRKNLQKFAV